MKKLADVSRGDAAEQFGTPTDWLGNDGDKQQKSHLETGVPMGMEWEWNGW